MNPNKHCLYVIPDPAEEKTASGIEVPDAFREKPNRGVILKVGEEVHGFLQPKGRVSYNKHEGTYENIDGIDVIILNHNAIHGWEAPVSLTNMNPDAIIVQSPN